MWVGLLLINGRRLGGVLITSVNHRGLSGLSGDRLDSYKWAGRRQGSRVEKDAT